ncbi:MAG: hypothetical protein AAF560_31810 [Acidobacteriota bacterium]
MLVVLLAAGGGGSGPSEIAQGYGYPAGHYSSAEFVVSDDPAVMVLSVRHGDRSLRVWGDGRTELVTGSEDERETFMRRIERSRLLSLIRSAVDHGLAEFDADVMIHEMQGRPRDGHSLGGPPCPTGSERIEVTLRLVSYTRDSFKNPRVERAGFCAPETYAHIPQAQAFAELAALVEEELATARREGSIEIRAGPPYSEATFTLSNDPAKLILSLGRRLTLHETLVSRLFGDGRLEMELKERGHDPVIYERQMSYSEMVALVRIAVDHGFGEWDTEALREVFGIVRGGIDASGARGSIHLETYRRGDYAREGVNRQFRFQDVGLAREFSSHVPQVRGLLLLREKLNAEFEAVRREGGK